MNAATGLLPASWGPSLLVPCTGLALNTICGAEYTEVSGRNNQQTHGLLTSCQPVDYSISPFPRKKKIYPEFWVLESEFRSPLFQDTSLNQKCYILMIRRDHYIMKIYFDF